MNVPQDQLKLQLVGNQQTTSQCHQSACVICMVQCRHCQQQQLVGRSLCQKDQRVEHILPTSESLDPSHVHQMFTKCSHVHHIQHQDLRLAVLVDQLSWVSIWTLWRAAKQALTEGLLGRVACHQKLRAVCGKISQGLRVMLFAHYAGSK